ncbi:hypothetical protein Syun_023247 [Stephania yunnanensis]|uniref:Uncharacterized protein n=1 Tax=Stephania yunnanensis TaxID=152371 RepID=A0AAP0I393_9MAGN
MELLLTRDIRWRGSEYEGDGGNTMETIHTIEDDEEQLQPSIRFIFVNRKGRLITFLTFHY